MALTTIYPNGVSTVNVPKTESIAISNYGGGIASIYYLVENANRPNAFQLQQTLENAGVVLGAFADGKTVKIEAGGSTVIFDVGASPDTGIGNADTLNGLASDTTDTADTIAARDSNGDIQANAFESTVATGTAPLTVASTTAVTNLNADQTDGYNVSESVNPSTIVARDTSSDVSARVYKSTVVTGTAPLAVASTTRVNNLNVERFDNLTSSQLLRSDAEDTIDAGNNASPLNIQRSSQTAEEISIAFKTDGAWTRYFGMDNGVPKWGTSDALSSTGIEIESVNPQQGTPTAETTSTTLTAADIAAKIITVNNGAAGTTTLTLPLASAMDSGFPAVQSGRSVDFYVINISTVAAEDADIAINTGWTLVGDMNIEANDAARARSSAKFRARKTGAGAWTLYRLS